MPIADCRLKTGAENLPQRHRGMTEEQKRDIVLDTDAGTAFVAVAFGVACLVAILFEVLGLVYGTFLRGPEGKFDIVSDIAMAVCLLIPGRIDAIKAARIAGIVGCVAFLLRPASLLFDDRLLVLQASSVVFIFAWSLAFVAVAQWFRSKRVKAEVPH